MLCIFNEMFLFLIKSGKLIFTEHHYFPWRWYIPPSPDFCIKIRFRTSYSYPLAVPTTSIPVCEHTCLRFRKTSPRQKPTYDILFCLINSALSFSDYVELNIWVIPECLNVDIFWDIAPCRSYWSDVSEESFHLHLQGRKWAEKETRM
jgi:hypothetical protein